MTDLERVLVYGMTYDRIARENGYTGKSCIPWGKVGLCIGLDILNGAVRSAKRSSYHSTYKYKRRKRY